MQRPFECTMAGCGRAYKRQDHLNRHLLTHQGKIFLCTVEGCKISFTIKANLQRHLKAHEKWGTRLGGYRKRRASEGNLECSEPGCGKTFRYPSLLRTHKDNVHGQKHTMREPLIQDLETGNLPIVNGVVPIEYKAVACMEPGCGEIFQCLTKLRAHIRVSHSYVVCDICGTSMSKKQLKQHLLKHDEKPPLFQCTYPGCIFSYSTKSNLDQHIRAVHLELKPYGCSHTGCGKRFAYKAVRDKHEMSGLHRPPSQGDFEAEDIKFQLKPRGGRQRVTLQRVEDLVRRQMETRDHVVK